MVPDDFSSAAADLISLSARVQDTPQKRTTEQGALAKGKVQSIFLGSKMAPGLGLSKSSLKVAETTWNCKIKVGIKEIEVNPR